MARIHEQLHMTRNVAVVVMSDYLANLCEQLSLSYGLEMSEITVHVADVSLSMDMAVPCGLIVNELVTNAFTHAYPGETAAAVASRLGSKESLVTVSLGQHVPDGENGDLVLEVRDHGVGLPEGFDIRGASSLGLRLVHLLTRQMGGRIDIAQAMALSSVELPRSLSRDALAPRPFPYVPPRANQSAAAFSSFRKRSLNTPSRFTVEAERMKCRRVSTLHVNPSVRIGLCISSVGTQDGLISQATVEMSQITFDQA